MTDDAPDPARPSIPPDERTLKALAHPLRYRLIMELAQRVASPNQLARELGESVNVVAYHVRYLRDLNALELVDTAQRRGATEHFYRATIRPWFSEEEYSLLPPGARRTIVAPTLRQVFEDADAALAGGGFDRSDVRVHRSVLALDPQAMQEATAVIDATLERLQALEQEAADRVGEGEDDPRRRTEFAFLHFDLPPVGQADTAAG